MPTTSKAKQLIYCYGKEHVVSKLIFILNQTLEIYMKTKKQTLEVSKNVELKWAEAHEELPIETFVHAAFNNQNGTIENGVSVHLNARSENVLIISCPTPEIRRELEKQHGDYAFHLSRVLSDYVGRDKEGNKVEKMEVFSGAVAHCSVNKRYSRDDNEMVPIMINGKPHARGTATALKPLAYKMPALNKDGAVIKGAKPKYMGSASYLKEVGSNL